MKIFNLQVIIEKDEDGVYIVDCPAIQGCHSYGYTKEEALKNIKEAIELCLVELDDNLRESEIKYPSLLSIENIEVEL